jgi:hypothetical protein
MTSDHGQGPVGPPPGYADHMRRCVTNAARSDPFGDIACAPDGSSRYMAIHQISFVPCTSVVTEGGWR